MPHSLLNLAEAAAYLHLDPSDVKVLATHGEIPCERRGDDLFFRRGELKVWSSQRILGLSGKHLHDYHSRGVLHPHDLSDHAAILTDLSEPAYLEPQLEARTRAAVLRRMVEVAERTGFLYDPTDLHEELLAREDLCSTGIEGGAAILHPRFHDPYMVEDSFVCLGRTLQPIPFGAPDGKRTDIFFLACCQDDRIHLHTLARISLVCHATDLLPRLRQAESEAEMHEAIRETERELLKG
jgi:PTS system nitrogen regulatory IIA component